MSADLKGKYLELLEGLISLRLENPPETREEFEDEELKHRAITLSFIQDHDPPFKGSQQRYEKQSTLTGEKIPTYKGKPGIVGVFTKAWVIGPPRDIISYYLNKRGRRTKYGEFKGFIYTEIPDIDTKQLMTQYNQTTEAIRERNKIREWRRKHGISKTLYEKHLKHNTLTDFIEGKEILTDKERHKRKMEKAIKKGRST